MDTQAAVELRRQAQEIGVFLDAEQVRRLLGYERLLVDRGPELGLVSQDDVRRIRERHVLDSLRAALAVEPQDSLALDLGSGGGMPGIPVAVASPDLRVVLVESRTLRAAFLELAVERLELRNVEVSVGRIEQAPEAVDLCFARALAPLPASWELAEPHLRPGGRLVYFAGVGSQTLAPPSGSRLVSILEAPTLASAGVLAIIGRP